MTAPLLERAGIDLDCTPSLDDGAALLVLAPGGVVICSATLELTQADIEGALLGNTVLAMGEASDGQTVQAEKYLDQDLRQEVGLSVGATKRIVPRVQYVGGYHELAADYKSTTNVLVG